MVRLALLALVLSGLAACAAPPGRADRSVDAVAQDEAQRQKVLGAIQSGATPDKAMDRVADGPKQSEPTLPQAAPK
jgi:hypothetical protein